MKKLILLSSILLIAGCMSIAAQQRGNPSRGDRVGGTPGNVGTVRARNGSVNRVERRNGRIQRTGDRPTDIRRRPAKIKKLLKGLHLSNAQKRQTKQILKNAKENGTPKNEVLREINSILNPRQSAKFKKKLKRLYKKKKGDSSDSPPTDGDNSQTPD